MKKLDFLRFLAPFLILSCSQSPHRIDASSVTGNAASTANRSIHASLLQTIEGSTVAMDDFRGKVLVIANLSIGCATAPQLADLEQLYQEYRAKGLVVIGFPSDDFAPPGHSTAAEKTATFCRKRYGVTFPLSSPAHVRGDHQHPIYRQLISNGPAETTGPVSFNLEKFVIDKSGKVRARFGPFTNVASAEFKETINLLLSE